MRGWEPTRPLALARCLLPGFGCACGETLSEADISCSRRSIYSVLKPLIDNSFDEALLMCRSYWSLHNSLNRASMQRLVLLLHSLIVVNGSQWRTPVMSTLPAPRTQRTPVATCSVSGRIAKNPPSPFPMNWLCSFAFSLQHLRFCTYPQFTRQITDSFRVNDCVIPSLICDSFPLLIFVQRV